MIYAFIEANKADLPVRWACARLGVSHSGFYDWRARRHTPCQRARQDAELTSTIVEIHRQSRGTYGCTRRDPVAVPSDDLVGRLFDPDRPDRLWCADITEHPTADGKVYLAVVIDAFSRLVVGWSIADHLRAELVVDALDMAIWRRKPAAGTVHHADHGTQYTSWAFGQRLRHAGLLGSMGTVGDALDNAVAEAFFATLQVELLDRHSWTDRRQLARAIFEFIECFYNPVRRHSYCKMLSPADYDRTYRLAAQPAA